MNEYIPRIMRSHCISFRCCLILVDFINIHNGASIQVLVNILSSVAKYVNMLQTQALWYNTN